jgi:hypothetical protein
VDYSADSRTRLLRNRRIRTRAPCTSLNYRSQTRYTGNGRFAHISSANCHDNTHTDGIAYANAASAYRNPDAGSNQHTYTHTMDTNKHTYFHAYADPYEHANGYSNNKHFYSRTYSDSPRLRIYSDGADRRWQKARSLLHADANIHIEKMSKTPSGMPPPRALSQFNSNGI